MWPAPVPNRLQNLHFCTHSPVGQVRARARALAKAPLLHRSPSLSSESEQRLALCASRSVRPVSTHTPSGRVHLLFVLRGILYFPASLLSSGLTACLNLATLAKRVVNTREHVRRRRGS